jgi:hypothetical protein
MLCANLLQRELICDRPDHKVSNEEQKATLRGSGVPRPSAAERQAHSFDAAEIPSRAAILSGPSQPLRETGVGGWKPGRQRPAVGGISRAKAMWSLLRGAEATTKRCAEAGFACELGREGADR